MVHSGSRKKKAAVIVLGEGFADPSVKTRRHTSNYARRSATWLRKTGRGAPDFEDAASVFLHHFTETRRMLHQAMPSRHLGSDFSTGTSPPLVAKTKHRQSIFSILHTLRAHCALTLAALYRHGLIYDPNSVLYGDFEDTYHVFRLFS